MAIRSNKLSMMKDLKFTNSGEGLNVTRERSESIGKLESNVFISQG